MWKGMRIESSGRLATRRCVLRLADRVRGLSFREEVPVANDDEAELEGACGSSSGVSRERSGAGRHVVTTNAKIVDVPVDPLLIPAREG
eukprot:11524548-Heterocapsa_arctica.AAC.1